MTSAVTWARLSFRQQRWELLLVALGVIATAAAMVWFASILDGMRAASPECLAGVGQNAFTDEGPPVACEATLSSYYEAESMASNLVNLAWAAPFGMGVILGAPLVAREIDGGTAQLAWSLSRSRVGWLLRRIAFVTLFGAALLAVLAIASQLLTAAMFPDRTLAEDFIYFGRRDLPVVARGLGAIMVGVLVGAVIGRVLPAVLASAVVIGLVFAAVSIGQDRLNRAEAVPQRFVDESGNPVAYELTGLDVDYGLQTPDGEFLSYSEAFERGLSPNFSDERGGVYASEEDLEAGRLIGHDARLSIPGERYQPLMLRDSAFGVLVGLGALAATAGVVVRRRPV